MVTGSCLCGTVRWQVDGSLDSMSHCHCSMCRKAHGAPFGTYTEAPSESFTWLSGMDAITSFESSPGIIRAFCGTCGSVVPEPFGKDRMVIPAGCLDGDPGVRPSSHIFAASKAPWHVSIDNVVLGSIPSVITTISIYYETKGADLLALFSFRGAKGGDKRMGEARLPPPCSAPPKPSTPSNNAPPNLAGPICLFRADSGPHRDRARRRPGNVG